MKLNLPTTHLYTLYAMPKLRGRRNAIVEAISKTYVEFASNTSIHGFKYTVGKDTNYFERAVWVCIIGLGVIGSALMFGLFWVRYISTPTRSIVLTNYLPNIEVDFPTITICPFSNTMASKFRSVLTESEREYAKRMFPYIQMESRENNFTEEHYDPVTILRKMSQNCTEFLQKCRWEGVEVNCDDLFSEIIIPSGLCYSLNNFNKTYRRTSNFSYKMGLSVLINPDLKDHMTNKITKGITTFIHDPTYYSDGETYTRTLTPGTVTFMQLSAQKFICDRDLKDLPKHRRGSFASSEKSLQFFQNYSVSNCATELYLNAYMEKCQCYPYYFVITGGPYCNLSQSKCALNDMERALLENITAANCIMNCDGFTYLILLTQTKLVVFNESVSSSFLSNVTVSEDSIHLHVFFHDRIQSAISTKPVTSLIYLLSSLGGTFSLFLGCSFISVFEIIYYSCIKFYLNLKSESKVGDRTIMKVNELKCKRKVTPLHRGDVNVKVYTMYKGRYLE